MDSNYGMNSTEVSDSVTGTSGMTVNYIVLCHLFALLKQWVGEQSIGPNISTINPDTDINRDNDTAFIFSTADCIVYNNISTRHGYGPCEFTAEEYNYGRDMHGLLWLTDCVLLSFMRKMGANEKCSNISLGYNNNTKDENAMTLLSKDRILYSFMNDFLIFLKGFSVCEKNTTVSHVTVVKSLTSTTNICDFYSQFTSPDAENVCKPTGERDTLGNDARISHYDCVWYPLLTELGVTSFCNRCDMYNFVMDGTVGGVLSIIGIVCNIGSLIVFCHCVIKTPTTYQLRCLALVDTIFLVLYFIRVAFPYIIQNYLQIDDATWYGRVIDPYILVCILPVFSIAHASTNWLTVFIGVYRYLQVCKPVSNSYHHVEWHRRKYVKIMLSMAALWKIPYFFERSLAHDDENNKVDSALTSFGKSHLFKSVYENIMDPAITICLPVIILIIVTVKIIVVLRKKQRTVQDSNTSNLNFDTVLVTVILTFLSCQLPLLVDSILHFIYGLSASTPPGCGSFHFYNTGLLYVFLVLNSAARPFIYMVLKNHFTWSLRHNFRNERTESIEMGSM